MRRVSNLIFCGARKLAAVLAASAFAALACAPAAAQDAEDTGTVMLVATPPLIDPDYRHTVLLATPIPGDRYIGVIINRPTRHSLASLFPEHTPSKRVRDPVYFGGPMLASAVFAVVKSDHNPGDGSIRMTHDLYFVAQAKTVDRIIEATPNDARYYVGYVEWRPGELRDEVNRGLWYVLDPDPDAVFRKDPQNLWEELLRRAQAITAWSTRAPAACTAHG